MGTIFLFKQTYGFASTILHIVWYLDTNGMRRSIADHLPGKDRQGRNHPTIGIHSMIFRWSVVNHQTPKWRISMVWLDRPLKCGFHHVEKRWTVDMIIPQNMETKESYPLVNLHHHGKSQFSMGKSTINGNVHIASENFTYLLVDLHHYGQIHHIFDGETHELRLGHGFNRLLSNFRRVHPQTLALVQGCSDSPAWEKLLAETKRAGHCEAWEAGSLFTGYFNGILMVF